MNLSNLGNMVGIKSSHETLEPPKVPGYSREQLGEKKIFLSWEATSHPETRGMNKRFIRALTIIGIFVGLLLLAMQEFFVILVIGSIIFVTQALMKMPPEKMSYELNSFGITVNGKLYYWDELRRYFFIQRGETEIAVVDTTMGIPGRLFIHFDPKDKEKIREVFNKYLHFLEQEPKTFFDNAYDKIVKKFGVEDKE
ncbi:MAG: hypothetical protein ABIJ82_03325 [Patescibacteria group bacterium]|nr:hypothetical protein [Patescibacteria group bacterium]MBU1952619.1 hypothetical protein [Patescibacteria group bacterium]